MRNIDIQNQSILVRKARNDPPLQPPHAQHFTPVLPVHAHRRPPVRPVLAEPRARVLGDGPVELRGVELRVLEPGPLARDVRRLGAGAQAQPAVHVGAELELGRLGAARREGELSEPVRDGLELEQGGQLDVHVRLADLGLHDGLDGLRVQDAHGDVLRDDLLVLAAEARLQVLLLEDAVLLVLVGEGVVPGLSPGRAAGGGVAAGGRRRDGHGEHGEAVLLGEAEGGRDAVEGRSERPLEGLQRQLEVDRVRGLSGLDVVVVEDEVHGKRAVILVSVPTHTSKRSVGGAHAQTWDPMSGITVKRTVSSLRRTHAIFSRVESAAVNSVRKESLANLAVEAGAFRDDVERTGRKAGSSITHSPQETLTCKGADVLQLGSEAHLSTLAH